MTRQYCCKTLGTIAVLVALVVSTASASAAVVRGRLVRANPQNVQSAAAGIAVTVSIKTSGTSTPAVVTKSDGMYYVYNVKPGSYYLEVWTTQGPSAKPTRYPIEVTEPLADIPPITLP